MRIRVANRKQRIAHNHGWNVYLPPRHGNRFTFEDLLFYGLSAMLGGRRKYRKCTSITGLT